MKMLFVCTGNLCRSPMAEGLMGHELARRGCRDIEVASAGTWAGLGHHATPEAVRAAAALGVDIARHRSRPLESSELRRADLIVAMTSVHVKEILSVAPEAASKLLLLKQLVETEFRQPPPEASPRDRLRALLTARRPELRRAHDLDDPIGLGYSAYQRCLSELRRGIETLADVLCG